MTSSDAFSLLGLSRKGVTEAAVKKAYAALLKEVRPDEDRERFIRLREAFEIARKTARGIEQRRSSKRTPKTEDSRSSRSREETTATVGADTKTDAEETDRQNVKASKHENVEELSVLAAVERDHPLPKAEPIDQVRMLISEPWRWQSLDSWREIVDQDELQTVDDHQLFEQELRSLVCQESGLPQLEEPVVQPWMTRQTMEFLDQRFGWTRNTGRSFWEQAEFRWLYSLYSQFEWFERRPALSDRFSAHRVVHAGTAGRPPLFFHPAAVVAGIYLAIWIPRGLELMGYDGERLAAIGPWFPTFKHFLLMAFFLTAMVFAMHAFADLLHEVRTLIRRGFRWMLRKHIRSSDYGWFGRDDWLALAIVVAFIFVVEKNV